MTPTTVRSTSVVTSPVTAPTSTTIVTPKFVAPFSTPTVATAPWNASGADVGQPTGSLTGQLGPVGAVVDVPLQGPGSWIIQATAPVLKALSCGGPAQAVTGLVSVSSLTMCDLQLTSLSPTQVTWQVVATP